MKQTTADTDVSSLDLDDDDLCISWRSWMGGLLSST